MLEDDPHLFLRRIDVDFDPLSRNANFTTSGEGMVPHGLGFTGLKPPLALAGARGLISGQGQTIFTGLTPVSATCADPIGVPRVLTPRIEMAS